MVRRLALKSGLWGISRELYNLLENQVDSGRFQSVIQNGPTLSWRPAGVPQGLILGLSLLLVYIKDLLNKLKSNAKLFADETCCFIVVKNKNERANTFNKD